MLARILSIAGALAVAAWFALGVVQSQSADRATSILAAHPRLTEAQAAHADSLLDTAATLNPDRSVTLERGTVALQSGRPRRALSIELPVTRSEPLNVNAWVAVARAASAAGDHPVAARAERHVLALYGFTRKTR